MLINYQFINYTKFIKNDTIQSQMKGNKCPSLVQTVPLKMKCFQDVVRSEHTEFLCEAHTPPTTHKILQVKRHEHDFQKTTSKIISIMSVQGDFTIHSTEVNSTGSNQRYTDLHLTLSYWRG